MAAPNILVSRLQQAKRRITTRRGRLLWSCFLMLRRPVRSLKLTRYRARRTSMAPPLWTARSRSTRTALSLRGRLLLAARRYPIASTISVPADASLIVADKTTGIYLEEGTGVSGHVGNRRAGLLIASAMKTCVRGGGYVPEQLSRQRHHQEPSDPHGAKPNGCSTGHLEAERR